MRVSAKEIPCISLIHQKATYYANKQFWKPYRNNFPFLIIFSGTLNQFTWFSSHDNIAQNLRRDIDSSDYCQSSTWTRVSLIDKRLIFLTCIFYIYYSNLHSASSSFFSINNFFHTLCPLSFLFSYPSGLSFFFIHHR